MSVIMLPTWGLAGITLNTVDAGGVEWIVDRDEGWDAAPGPRLQLTERPSGHGAYDGKVWLDPRAIVLSGRITALTRADLDAALRILAAVGTDGNRTLLTVTEPAETLTSEVRLATRTDVRRRTTTWADFQLSLIAPDPRKHGPWPSAAEAGLPVAPPGGLNASPPGLNASPPGLDAGTPGSSGFVSVTNTGTAPAYPLIRFLGPLTNPRLSDVTTGDQLSFDGVLGESENVVINGDSHPIIGSPLGDHAGLSVVLNGTADRSGSIAIVGDWPVVQPGQTLTWAFSADNTSTTARAEVYLRPAVW